MPEKVKLDIKSLKVKSFVTSLEKEDKITIKGGVTKYSECIESCMSICTCPSGCGSCDC